VLGIAPFLGGLGGSVSHVIEGVPEIVSSIRNDTRYFNRNRLGKLEFYNLLAAIGLDFGYNPAAGLLKVVLLHGIKFHCMLFCPLYFLPSAIEDSRSGQRIDRKDFCEILSTASNKCSNLAVCITE